MFLPLVNGGVASIRPTPLPQVTKLWTKYEKNYLKALESEKEER